MDLQVKEVALDDSRIGYQFFDPDNRSDRSVSVIVINKNNKNIEFINGSEDTYTKDEETNEIISPFKINTSPNNSLFYKYHPFIHKFCLNRGFIKNSAYYSRIPTIKFEGEEISVYEMLVNNRIDFLLKHKDKMNIGSQKFHKSFDEDVVMGAILNRPIEKIRICEFDFNLYNALKVYKNKIGLLHFEGRKPRIDNPKRCYDVLECLDIETLKLDVSDLEDKDVKALADILSRAKQIKTLSLEGSSYGLKSDLSPIFKALSETDIDSLNITLDLTPDNYQRLFEQIPSTNIETMRFSSSMFLDKDRERPLTRLAELLSKNPVKVYISDSDYISDSYSYRLWEHFSKIESTTGVKSIKNELYFDGGFDLYVALDFDSVNEDEFELSNYLKEWVQRAKSDKFTEIKNEKLLSSVPFKFSLTTQSEYKTDVQDKVILEISQSDWDENKGIFEHFIECLIEQGFSIEVNNLQNNVFLQNKDNKIPYQDTPNV